MILALTLFLTAIASYLLGSLNFSFIIPKRLRSIDIREVGSKNAGATNVTRNLGKRVGMFCMIMDILKGSMAVMFGFIIHWAMLGAPVGANITMFCGGFFAIAGHVFPLYYKFKGGKGVATLGGAIIALDYRQAALLLVLFVLIIFISKMVSLGSVISASLYIPVIIVFELFNPKHTVNSLIIRIVFAVLSASLIIFMHRENLERISKGTERKIGEGNPHDEKKSTIF